MVSEENVSLKKYNTFGLDYKADRIIHVSDEAEIRNICRSHASERHFILGGGSNLLFTRDYDGTIIHHSGTGIKIEKTDPGSVLVTVEAGLNWDLFVEWTVKNELYGLENLSLIPGNVGASPVQNIGAYGAEVSDYIEKVEAIRISDGKKVLFGNNECGFDYRYSIFKGEEKGRYIVTQIHFRLGKSPSFILDYGTVKEEALKMGKISQENIRQAVINIRRSKLPDPAVTGNAGSFFKNPVVPVTIVEEIKQNFPAIPVYPEKSGFLKIAAGWLIEQCGLKGTRSGDAGVHEKQALVIINYGKATGKEIYELSELVRNKVRETFGISLEREVEIVGST